MITEDYVSFEVAKLLKEKGFDEKCFALYNPDGTLIQNGIRLNNTQVNRVKGSYSAPTHQMATKWLKEAHKIVISIYPFNSDWKSNEITQYTCSIATTEHNSKYGHLRGIWKFYEEAVEAALDYSLKNLI